MDRLIIGITGGIASGKSTFLAILGDNGFHTISADDIVGKLYQKKAPGYKGLIKLKIDGLFDKDGNLNKKKLREIIFSDSSTKDRVEEIIHPFVIEEIKKQIQASTSNKVVVEIPLLFEVGLENICTYTVTISAKKELMIKNIKDRYVIGKNEAEKMINSQMDIKIKMKKSDFVIINDGNLEDFKCKTLEFIKNLDNKKRGKND